VIQQCLDYLAVPFMYTVCKEAKHLRYQCTGIKLKESPIWDAEDSDVESHIKHATTLYDDAKWYDTLPTPGLDRDDGINKSVNHVQSLILCFPLVIYFGARL
jgi:hypothetical protein